MNFEPLPLPLRAKPQVTTTNMWVYNVYHIIIFMKVECEWGRLYTAGVLTLLYLWLLIK